MKGKFFILITLILAPYIGSAQSDKYTYLVDKLCNEINPERIKKLPPEKIQTELIKLGNKVRIENQDKVNELMRELRHKYPNSSDKKLLKEYLKNFTYQAIDRCPVYFELMLLPLGDCPKDNNTLIFIKQEVEKFLTTNSNKPYTELSDLVVEHIVTTVFNHKKMIEKDYKDGILNPQFKNDLNIYLYHKSKKYTKVSLSSQIEEIFDMQ